MCRLELLVATCNISRSAACIRVSSSLSPFCCHTNVIINAHPATMTDGSNLSDTTAVTPSKTHSIPFPLIGSGTSAQQQEPQTREHTMASSQVKLKNSSKTSDKPSGGKESSTGGAVTQSLRWVGEAFGSTWGPRGGVKPSST